MTQGGGRSAAHALWAGLDAEYERYKESVGYIPTQKVRIQEDLRRYLCMRCAGFLEQVTYVVLTEYLTQKSAGPPLVFAKSYFTQAPNLRAEAFVRLIGKFGDAHRRQFEAFLTPVRHEALSDLLSVRNDVAHGKHQGGRKLDPRRYVDLCEEIYVWLVEHFLGGSVEVLDELGEAVTAYEGTSS